MFLEFFETTTTDRLGRIWTRQCANFRCDHCEKIYVSSNNLKRDLKRKRNYCSKLCSDESKKPGGLSFEAFKATNLERYGVEAPAQNPGIREKQNQTNIERYGSRSSFGGVNTQHRAIQTRQNKYGVSYSAQIPGVMEKIATTNLKRYGTINPMNSKQIVAKYDYDEMFKKRIETGKKNGTIGYRRSNSEIKFHELLKTKFSEDDIEIQTKIPGKRWTTDFYIKSIATHIQIDGIYWHGLDRPIEIIAKERTKQDVQIYKKWKADREQERWFVEHKLQLLRITDKQLQLIDKLPDDLASIAYFSSGKLVFLS